MAGPATTPAKSARLRWRASREAGHIGASAPVVVEFGHHPPAGFPGCGEFLVAFFERALQVEDLLAEAVGLRMERCDMSSRSTSGATPASACHWA
jgi:hypothetical protein